MNSHKPASLTPKGRALRVRRVLDKGWSVARPAAEASKYTCFKWRARLRTECAARLANRSLRPLRRPRALTAPEQAGIESLRRPRWSLWRTLPRSGVASALQPLHEPTGAVAAEVAGAGSATGGPHQVNCGAWTSSQSVAAMAWATASPAIAHGTAASAGTGVHLAINDHSHVSFALIKTDERGKTARRSCAWRRRTALA